MKRFKRIHAYRTALLLSDRAFSCVTVHAMPVDVPKIDSGTSRRLNQSAAGASTPCTLPAENKSTHTLTLPPNYLQPDMVYEFTVTVTSASTGKCTSDRSATERRVITTQSEPLPELQLQVCKDALCATQFDLVGGVATVNADRQNPNLYVKLGVESDCKKMKVAWSTSVELAHLTTKDLLKQHTLKPSKFETLRVLFNYVEPISAEYTFTTTAKCSTKGSSSASVDVGIVMNYGPSGGKMEVGYYVILLL